MLHAQFLSRMQPDQKRKKRHCVKCLAEGLDDVEFEVKFHEELIRLSAMSGNHGLIEVSCQMIYSPESDNHKRVSAFPSQGHDDGLS